MHTLKVAEAVVAEAPITATFKSSSDYPSNRTLYLSASLHLIAPLYTHSPPPRSHNAHQSALQRSLSPSQVEAVSAAASFIRAGCTALATSVLVQRRAQSLLRVAGACCRQRAARRCLTTPVRPASLPSLFVTPVKVAKSCAAFSPGMLPAALPFDQLQ
jgi:hypothetical protein